MWSTKSSGSVKHGWMTFRDELHLEPMTLNETKVETNGADGMKRVKWVKLIGVKLKTAGCWCCCWCCCCCWCWRPENGNRHFLFPFLSFFLFFFFGSCWLVSEWGGHWCWKSHASSPVSHRYRPTIPNASLDWPPPISVHFQSSFRADLEQFQTNFQSGSPATFVWQ